MTRKMMINEAFGVDLKDTLDWVKKKNPNMSPAQQLKFAQNIINKRKGSQSTTQSSQVNAQTQTQQPNTNNTTVGTQVNTQTPKQTNVNDYDVYVYTQDTKDNPNTKKIVFQGIKTKQDVDDILGRLLDGVGFGAKVKPDKHILKAWAKGNQLFVMIDKNEYQEFLQTGMKSITTSLIRSGNYDPYQIEHLPDMLDGFINMISADEKKQMYKDAEASVAELWTSYLNKMNDPETVKILKLYSKIFGNSIYGHTLSLKNVMTIKTISSKSNLSPTFVLSRNTWRKYGRAIKAGAKKYPLWTILPFDINSVSKGDIDKARNTIMADLGQTDAYDELGVTVKNKIDIEVNRLLAKDNKRMIQYFGYDIADTYLVNPLEDPLKTKPNIANNIEYELNDLAKQAEAKKQETNELGTDEQSRMARRTEVAADAMAKYCELNNIDVKGDVSTPDNKLLNTLLSYYRTLVTPKANVLHPNNIEQYARDSVQLTLIMTDTGLNLLNKFTHSLQYTQKEAVALAPIISKAVSKIGEALGMMIESINLNENFMDKLYNAMKQLGIKIVDDNTGNSELIDNETNTNVVENIDRKKEVLNDFNNYMKRLNNPCHGEYYE